MIFSREYIGYLARRTVKHLIDAKMITTSDLKGTESRVTDGLVEELSLEDRINDEVRVILEAYSDEMRKSRRAICRDVQEGENRAGPQVQGGAMRISRDKLNKLAHTVADTLAEIDQVGFLEDRNTIRQEARKALETLLTEEARSTRPPALRSPTSARSSWKARRSGRSSTASITTTKYEAGHLALRKPSPMQLNVA